MAPAMTVIRSNISFSASVIMSQQVKIQQLIVSKTGIGKNPTKVENRRWSYLSWKKPDHYLGLKEKMKRDDILDPKIKNQK